MSRKKSSSQKLPAGQSILLLPGQLPQQRLVLVETLPTRPKGFELVLARLPTGVEKHSSETQTLCQLEWAWSPMHNRIQTWAITPTKCEGYYVLETGFFNDESLFQYTDEDGEVIDGPEPWEFHDVGYCRIHPELCLHDHAVLLLHDCLLGEATDGYLDRYHWINDDDLVTCEDLEAIARSVWGEQ